MNYYVIPKNAHVVGACLQDAASCIALSATLSRRALATALLVAGLVLNTLNTSVYYPLKTLVCFSVGLIAWPCIGDKCFVQAKNSFIDWSHSLLLTVQLIQDCFIAPFFPQYIHQIRRAHTPTPLATLDFSYLHAGFGETKRGAQWKDLPTIVKCIHVLKACLKVVACSVGAGIITSLVAPSAILAPLIATLVAMIGIGLIAKSFYTLAIKQPQKTPPTLDKSAYRPGHWSYNMALITKNGSESLQLKLDLIDRAEHCIEISGSYCGGKIFDATLDKIEKKLETNPNLQVSILTDPTFLTKTNREKIAHLAQSYYENFMLIETPKQHLFLPTHRTVENHAKLFIIDGNTCMTGGTGIQDRLAREEAETAKQTTLEESALGSGIRDADALVQGPVAKTMRNEFYKLFEKWRRLSPISKQHGNCKRSPALCNKAPVCKEALYKEMSRAVPHVRTTLLTGGVEHGNQHACKQGYINMIRYAKKSIVVANMNFNQPEILQALYAAALRGVKIKVITNANQSDSPIGARVMGVPNTAAFPEFLEKGVEIYEYKKPGVLYHKKIMIVDDHLTTIGSFNISHHSAHTEDEDIVVMDSTQVAENTLDGLREDMQNSERASHEAYEGFFGKIGRSILSHTILQITAHTLQ